MKSSFSKRMEKLTRKLQKISQITQEIAEDSFKPTSMFYCKRCNAYHSYSEAKRGSNGMPYCPYNGTRLRTRRQQRKLKNYNQYAFGVSLTIALASKFKVDPWTVSKMKGKP